MNLFDLTAKLTLDTSDYNKKINEVKTETNNVAKNTQKSTVKSAIAWGAVATAVVAVVSKVKDLIVETANYADQIGDLAEKWGFTTREIQEFDYWATMNGTTLDSLLTGMRGLVNQAEAGSDAFDKLGVSVRNADGSLKDQKTLFLETIDALQKIDNQTERNALQFEVFGRAGIDLGQIINRDSSELAQLSQEAENLGIILSDNTIAMAGNFNDTLDQIRLSFKSVFAELIGGAEDAPKKFEAFLESLAKQVEQWLPQLLAVVIQLFPKILAITMKLIAQIPTMLMDALTQVNWLEFFVDFFKGFVESLVATVKNMVELLFGKGWLWGKNTQTGTDTSAFKESMTSLSSEYTNSYSDSSSRTTDNSKYNIEISMTTTGYSEEDAKKLANDIIKEISTKKQASGR